MKLAQGKHKDVRNKDFPPFYVKYIFFVSVHCTTKTKQQKI